MLGMAQGSTGGATGREAGQVPTKTRDGARQWVLPGPKKPRVGERHTNATVRPAKRWSVVSLFSSATGWEVPIVSNS